MGRGSTGRDARVTTCVGEERGIRGGEGSSVGEDRRRRKGRRLNSGVLDFGVIGIFVRIRLAWRE